MRRWVEVRRRKHQTTRWLALLLLCRVRFSKPRAFGVLSCGRFCAGQATVHFGWHQRYTDIRERKNCSIATFVRSTLDSHCLDDRAVTARIRAWRLRYRINAKRYSVPKCHPASNEEFARRRVPRPRFPTTTWMCCVYVRRYQTGYWWCHSSDDKLVRWQQQLCNILHCSIVLRQFLIGSVVSCMRAISSFLCGWRCLHWIRGKAIVWGRHS